MRFKVRGVTDADHSLQAIIHAKQNVQFQDIGRRFHTIIFLATPHREAEDHQMLQKVLRACNTSASRTDAIEPDPNTLVAQEINNDFYAYSQDLAIWSFYEATGDPAVTKRRATMSKLAGLHCRSKSNSSQI